MTPPFRLAKFGTTYIQHNEALASGHLLPPDLSVQTITDLTFEVSAAVARLALSIKDWSDGRSPTTESLLAQTVRLVKSVRLARITRLAAAAESQLLPHLQKGDHQGAENDTAIETEPGTSGRAGSDSPAQLLQDGAAATTTALLDELPSLVRDQVSSVLDRVRDQMSEQLRDLVRDAVRAEMDRQQEVAEVASLSPSEMRRSRIWGAFSWGSR